MKKGLKESSFYVPAEYARTALGDPWFAVRLVTVL